jgi:hypothetical protein
MFRRPGSSIALTMAVSPDLDPETRMMELAPTIVPDGLIPGGP